MSEVRLSWVVSQPLQVGVSDVRLTVTFVEPLIDGYPKARLNLLFVEPLIDGYPNVRLSLMGLQALFPATEEPPVPTDPFPGFGNSVADPTVPAAADPASTSLPGLAFSVHKRPAFSTKISTASNNREVRTSYTPYPVWEFELTYEFLEDRSGADSSLKTIMGFFTDMQGSFGTWLFKDPDDYLVYNGQMGVGDGVTTEFYFLRYIGTRGEPVGMVDTANTLDVIYNIEEISAVPITPGPYTVTVVNAADFYIDNGVTKSGVPLTKVTGAPGASQYAVNTATGVYTFSSVDQGDAIVISYGYVVAPADYTLYQNRLVFDTAPADTVVVTASFQFYFVCRFLEDDMDFEKFYDQLWSLQTCSFKSILQ